MCVSLSVSVSMRLCDGVCLGLTLGHDEVSGLSGCVSVYESGLERGLFPSIPSLPWPRESVHSDQPGQPVIPHCLALTHILQILTPYPSTTTMTMSIMQIDAHSKWSRVAVNVMKDIFMPNPQTQTNVPVSPTYPPAPTPIPN